MPQRFTPPTMALSRSHLSGFTNLFVAFAVTLAISAGSRFAFAADAVDYVSAIKPILKRKCFSCHGALKQESELRVDTAAEMIGKDNDGVVVPGEPDVSLLLQRVASDDPDERMPPEGEPLTAPEIALVEQWIREGANAPRDETPQADPNQHWAFQPIRSPSVPPSKHPNSIDSFIEQRLSDVGLEFAPPADTVDLARRLHLDMLGLPPTPDEVESFRSASQVDAGDATRHRIDALLASPRYGERWAQHWLDVVRYADTHGFEVNTPRNNAWPYRDYVIQAFNEDKPYDQFVREQLAGDQMGQDAATGFLVAAPVLLPGQIGKDEASKRLARQDSLDEIIVGTSASFLGLSIGCARCHDHKFDPISQEDYYAMQAFFAGVHYGERKHRSHAQTEREQQATRIEQQLRTLRSRLDAFHPKAFTGRTLILDDEDTAHVISLQAKNGHGVNPAGTERGYRDDTGDPQRLGNLGRGRYTWWDNQPGVDVFTWNPSSAGTYRVWISWGVHGSGVHTRDARYVLDKDGDLKTTKDQTEIARADQYYFAGQSEGESKKTPLWSGLFDAGTHNFSTESRIVLRGGDTGTGITADVIVLQEVPQTQTALPLLRSPVSPKKNVEHFHPIDAKFVRLTTLATIDDNRHQPCIDELEIFAANDTQNIALASDGAVATSSGNYSETGKHQLKHVNDGRYGNSRSWISNEFGAGWVQLELPKLTTIDKVIWGRDREGNFKDRLPVDYTIAVSQNGEDWTTVASSSDRVPMGTPFDAGDAILRRSSNKQSLELRESFERLQSLEKQLTVLRKSNMVYAGIFKSPDPTHLLRRGDPEQPLSAVAPHTPAIIGSLRLAEDAAESERRTALANWIASPDNPLTARVMVNRLWQFHFGQGLVSTPSDFGLNGAEPSHP